MIEDSDPHDLPLVDSFNNDKRKLDLHYIESEF